MRMCLLKLPDDLLPTAEMTVETWQYPENPDWGRERDEQESLVESMLIESMRNVRRIWPLIRVIQWLSPRMRDLLCGHVWCEDGQIVGFTNANGEGGTDTWYTF